MGASMIGLVDYGMGNLASVRNALTYLGASVCEVHEARECTNVDALVLPGVGAFSQGMENLRKRGFIDGLGEMVLGRNMPFLGICLGMQLLATRGFEYGAHEGLGWCPGEVVRMADGGASEGIRIPHVGWNDVRFLSQEGLFRGLEKSAAFYFVHSYVVRVEDPSWVAGVFQYGGEYVCALEHNSIWATQFHPEKSHKTGLMVLKNWLRRWELC